MSVEAEILSKRLDKLEQAASEDRKRIKAAAELLHKLLPERATWVENNMRLNEIEEHLTAHCTEIDDLIKRSQAAEDAIRHLNGTEPVPLCPFCGEELHWARYANDKPYLRCPECGKTYLPPVLQPAGD